MSETRTEYAVKSSQLRHGKRTFVIEEMPGRATDKAAVEAQVQAERDWQASVGIEPDAVLVSRTVTVTDWA